MLSEATFFKKSNLLCVLGNANLIVYSQKAPFYLLRCLLSCPH